MDVRRQARGCSACACRRERTWLAVRRVPRRLTKSAGSPGRASSRPLRQPRRQSLQRRRADRHAAPLAALAEHVRAGVGGVDPAGGAAAGARRRARPARRRAGRSRRAARRCSASRAASTALPLVVAMRRPAPPRGRPRAPSAAAARRAARARLRPGWPRPGLRARASGRGRARPRATSAMLRGARPAAVQLRRPAPHVVHLRLRAAARRGAAKRCRRSKRLAVERQRARGEAALDREVLEMARRSASRRRRRRRTSRSLTATAAATAPRSRPRRCAPGSRCPCRRCSGSGRARRAPAGRRRRPGCSWRSGIIAIDSAWRRLVEPLHRLEAGVDAAVRHAQAGREALHVVARPAARTASAANASAAPQTRIAACGIRNWCCSSRTSTSGRSAAFGGEHQRAGPAMQLVGDRDVVLAVPDHLDRSAARSP